MDGMIVWIIIAAFYAPLHYLIPLLVVVIKTESADVRKQSIRKTLIDCTLSMAVAFFLVIWMAENQLQSAMIILFLSMLAPYPFLLLRLRKR